MAKTSETTAAKPGPPATETGRVVNPGAYTLVHFVSGNARKAMFSPTKLMNPVSYLGRTGQNDIVLASDNVSRRHAKLIVTDLGITVHDLDSHNGVFLNGKKVRSAPVNVGDLLYVADVCIELRRTPDTDAFKESKSRIQMSEITGEEDPDARALAALVRTTELMTTGDDEQFFASAIEIAREMVEATVAVLVQEGRGGTLETPVVLQPETGKRGEVPVVWPLIKKCMAEGTPVFSPDLKRQPIGAPSGKEDGGAGAVMIVPIVVDGGVDGCIYLSRNSPGPVFTQREVPTLSAVAQLFALRKAPQQAPAVIGMESQGDVVAAQAKAEAAEERLREAQDDMRALTERIHGLEADALKLKQQIEIEKQAALEAKREADRGRSEAAKLEQGLHKTDEDAKKLKEALVKSEEDRAKLRENVRAIDEDRKVRTADAEKLREALREVEAERDQLKADVAELQREGGERDDEIQRLSDELVKLNDEARTNREGLERAVSEHAGAAEALRAAMRATLPPMLAEHVEGAALEQRSVVTDVALLRPVAALFVTMRGFDAWAAQAPSEEIKRRLDHYCTSIALRARANGGRVDSVLGHAHLVLFPDDAASVRAAVRCGLEIAALVPEESGVAVTSALHVGASSTGFFGDEETATHVEAGEAVSVARGLSALVHDAGFYVSDAVHRLVGGDPAFVLAMAGPAAIVGGPTVGLFRVLPADSTAGAGGGDDGGGGGTFAESGGGG